MNRISPRVECRLRKLFNGRKTCGLDCSLSAQFPPKCLALTTSYSSSPSSAFPKSETAMNVFDRQAKAWHRDRSAIQEDHLLFDYLKEEIGYRVYDRVLDIKRSFETVVDLSAGKGFVGRNFTKETCSKLIQCDISREMLTRSARPQDNEIQLTNLLIDEDETYEGLPFDNNSIDLVISSLGLHWVNDLPGCFRNVWQCLKPDAGFLGAMFGGETLFELRSSLQLAELERQGGFSPHISPFVEMSDVGGVLNRAGFKMLTVDVDEIVVGYPSMFHLLQDLKGMAENNAAWKRPLHIQRDSLTAAAAIYQAMYGQENPHELGSTSIPATFQIVYFIGWKPDKSQAKPAARGSANMSMKDIDKIMAADTLSPESIDKLAKDLKIKVDDDEKET